MSTLKSETSLYIDHECQHIQDNYTMAGAWRVMRFEDIGNTYSIQRLTHIHRHGIEEPGADVIVHLVEKSNIAGFGLFIYLWQDQIWNSNTDIDRLTSDAAMMNLTRIGGLDG
jgi:hypothetical protein